MKKTQKLLFSFNDYEVETTFEKVPKNLLGLVDALVKKTTEYQDDGLNMSARPYQNDGSVIVAVQFVGVPPKCNKMKLFGIDEDEFLAKQYK